MNLAAGQNTSLFGSTTSLDNRSALTTLTNREMFTGRWSIFNDPNLNPDVIPDDKERREGLRVGLLVSSWESTHIGSTRFGMKLDIPKLIHYFYTQHDINKPLRLCFIRRFGTTDILSCLNFTKALVDSQDKRRSFDFIWKHNKHMFLTTMTLLPLISVTGIFGMNILCSLEKYSGVVILIDSSFLGPPDHFYCCEWDPFFHKC